MIGESHFSESGRDREDGRQGRNHGRIWEGECSLASACLTSIGCGEGKKEPAMQRNVLLAISGIGFNININPIPRQQCRLLPLFDYSELCKEYLRRKRIPLFHVLTD